MLLQLQFLDKLEGIYIYIVNKEIFAQYIFLRTLRRALDARKFDVSENFYHNRTNRNMPHRA